MACRPGFKSDPLGDMVNIRYDQGMFGNVHQSTETYLTIVLLTRVKYGSAAIGCHTLSIPEEGMFHQAFVSISVVCGCYPTDCVLSVSLNRDLLLIKVLYLGCLVAVCGEGLTKAKFPISSA